MRLSRVLALICSLMLAGAAGLEAQQRVVTGRVVDALTGSPIPQAGVTLAGTTIGVLTQADGRFSLAVPPGPAELQVVRIGFQRQTVTVPEGSGPIEVSLQTDFLGLEEVVVTGQSTGISRRNLPNAVSTVSAEQLGQAPSSSVEQMLAGKMAGVVIQQNSGAPGGGSRVRLRGLTSILVRVAFYVSAASFVVTPPPGQGGAQTRCRWPSGRDQHLRHRADEPHEPVSADLNPGMSSSGVEAAEGALGRQPIYGSKARQTG